MSSAILLAALLVPALPQDEEAKAKADVAAFDKGGGKSKKDPEVRNALTTHLAPVRHPLVLAKLKELLKHPSTPVRAETVYLMARYTDSADARAALVEALGKETRKATVDTQGNDVDAMAAVNILNALGGFPPSADMSEPVLKALRHDCLSIASAAAGACGKLKILDAVEPMISNLRKIESITAEPLKNERTGGVEGANQTAAQVKQQTEYRRKSELGPAIKVGLQTLLGTQVETSSEFFAFWEENAEKLRAAQKK